MLGAFVRQSVRVGSSAGTAIFFENKNPTQANAAWVGRPSPSCLRQPALH